MTHSYRKASEKNIYSLVKHPLVGEAASKLMEDQNTLVFIVCLQATKPKIKKAFEDRYGVKVKKVNTLVRPDGQKKAFITLTGEQEAVELGSKIGLI